jgi:parallel beta-helix repeat protein
MPLGYLPGEKGVTPRARTFNIEEPASYIVFIDDDGFIKAKNGKTGQIDFKGTDAAAVIQAALNALTPGRIWKEKVVLKGSFNISSGISVPSLTVIEINGVLIRTGLNYHLLSLDNVHGVEIRGGRIIGIHKEAEEYNTNEINVKDSNDVIVENVRIEDASEDGIMIRGGSYNVKVSKCSIINSYRHAIDITGTAHHIMVSESYVNGISIYDGITVYVSGGHTIAIVGNTVENVRGSSPSTSAIHVEDIVPSNVNNIIIVGNSIYDSKYGITVWQARPVALVGNIIRNAQRGIFLGNPLQSSISDNVINNNEVNEENYGIYIQGALGCSLKGNAVRGNPSYTYGIYWSTVGAFSDCSIVGNIIGTCLYGIYRVGVRNVFAENVLLLNNRHAIYISPATAYCLFIGNRFYNNGLESDNVYDDIYVDSTSAAYSYGLHFINGQSINDGANRVKNHIEFTAYTNYMMVVNNRAVGIRSLLINTIPVNSVVKNNIGYITENSGTATIPANSTSVTVAHGLSATPSKVVVTPRGNIGSVWVSARDATNITINCSTAPTVDTIVDWYAEV